MSPHYRPTWSAAFDHAVTSFHRALLQRLNCRISLWPARCKRSVGGISDGFTIDSIKYPVARMCAGVKLQQTVTDERRCTLNGCHNVTSQVDCPSVIVGHAGIYDKRTSTR